VEAGDGDMKQGGIRMQKVQFRSVRVALGIVGCAFLIPFRAWSSRVKRIRTDRENREILLQSNESHSKSVVEGVVLVRSARVWYRWVGIDYTFQGAPVSSRFD
jgi:hypothetical protein